MDGWLCCDCVVLCVFNCCCMGCVLYVSLGCGVVWLFVAFLLICWFMLFCCGCLLIVVGAWFCFCDCCFIVFG